MKIKVSNYISQWLVDHGIADVFSVTGGGAMHLNDALGHQAGLTVTYNHHEQACAMAAEAYARVDNRIAAVCVTTGPGGTNAITGVLGGWLDSIPMLVLSGQVRYDTTARSAGLPLRAMGDQEFDITAAVGCMCKYAEMVVDPLRIRHALEKALYLARAGRPGPCWLDIPLNVQGAYVETDDLTGFNPAECPQAAPPPPADALIDDILTKIYAAQRPVFYAGNGIRLSGAFEVFRSVARKLGVPVATCWDSIDLMPSDDPLYVGRGGIMGDRAGNFAVQNSDLVLAMGNRLSIRQVGYNHASWARAAHVVMVDIDEAELKKPTLHVETPVWADAALVLRAMDERLPDGPLFRGEEWLARCRDWKARYPVVQDKHTCGCEGANVYAMIHELSSRLPEGRLTVVGNGSACVVGSHAYVIKQDQRFLINSGAASMGYDLPAAIGACIAIGRGQTVCVTGDGSIQMNLQELQTIVHHRLPIKIFLINNNGYHSIRQTQKNFFGEPLVGVGGESGDLSFPDMGKLAWAYGIPYSSARANEELPQVLAAALSTDGPSICEVFVGCDQNFEPKSATKRLPDGTLVSAPLEDLAPFLSEEELLANLIIPPVSRP